MTEKPKSVTIHNLGTTPLVMKDMRDLPTDWIDDDRKRQWATGMNRLPPEPKP